MKTPPLWLPEGSIRALLTFGIVAFTCLCYGEGLGGNLPAYWDTVFVGVLGAYFGSRWTATKEK